MNKDIKKILETKSDNKLLFMLIGHPLVGKSTFIKNNLEGFDIISRDDILLEVANTQSYKKAWDNVDQSKVNIKLNDTINNLSSKSNSIIIDMTNMTTKGRKKHLNKFKDFHKIAVVFPFLNDDEILERNEKRKVEVDKWIPLNVIQNMKDSFTQPTEEEGFNDIINLINQK